MARYTVHIPAAATREEALERAVFVRDGWSWGAFAFGPLWLMSKRHWIAGLLALLAILALLAGLAALPIPAGAQVLAILALQVLLGLEGASLRRAALRAAGFEEAGLAIGQGQDEIERRFFAGAASEAVPPAPPPAAAPAPMAPPVLGLFPQARIHPDARKHP